MVWEQKQLLSSPQLLPVLIAALQELWHCCGSGSLSDDCRTASALYGFPSVPWCNCAAAVRTPRRGVISTMIVFVKKSGLWVMERTGNGERKTCLNIHGYKGVPVDHEYVNDSEFLLKVG